MEGYITALLDELLLDQILSRLSFPDIVSFGLVCKSWRSVMLAWRSFCHPPALLATLTKRNKPHRSGKPVSSGEEYEVSLFCFNVRKLHKLFMDSPVLELGEGDKFLPCMSESYGWMHVNQKDRWGWGVRVVGYLLNPLSGERIILPGTSDHNNKIDRVALSSPPTSSCCTVIGIMRNNNFPFLDASLGYLASWRRGDRVWNVFAEYWEDSSAAPLCMAIHKGELYVVHENGVTRVYRVDGLNGPEFSGFVDGYVRRSYLDDVYLVGTEELFLVARVCSKFDVFKLDGRRWVKITDLGDQALFVSDFSTHCYRTGEIMGLGLGSNCVYCFDYCVQGRILVYSMEDGSREWLLHPGVGSLMLMPNE